MDEEFDVAVAIITVCFVAWFVISLWDPRYCLPLFTIGAGILIAWAILGLIAVSWERLREWRSRRG